MRNKVLGCLSIGGVLLLIVSLVFNLFFFLDRLSSGGRSAHRLKFDKMDEVLVDGGESSRPKHAKKIIQIDLTGPIFNLDGGVFSSSNVIEPDATIRALRQASGDDDCAAIILRVNSPGGEVTASDIIYRTVREVNATKPVFVFMESVAASGGYYIACGAGQIVATPTTVTGSIGVIMQMPNVTGLMDKFGVSMNTFTSGDFKDTGSMTRFMREDEREYLQSQLEEIYGRFVGIVAEARKISVEDLKNGIADGRIFSGTEAQKAGLVDQVGYLEDVYAMARAHENVPDDAPVLLYHAQPSFANFLSLLGEAQAQKAAGGGAARVELNLAETVSPRLQPGRFYLFPRVYFP